MRLCEGLAVSGGRKASTRRCEALCETIVNACLIALITPALVLTLCGVLRAPLRIGDASTA